MQNHSLDTHDNITIRSDFNNPQQDAFCYVFNLTNLVEYETCYTNNKSTVDLFFYEVTCFEIETKDCALSLSKTLSLGSKHLLLMLKNVDFSMKAQDSNEKLAHFNKHLFNSEEARPIYNETSERKPCFFLLQNIYRKVK